MTGPTPLACHILYHIVLRQYINRSGETFEKIGLHPGQAAIIMVLAKREECSQREIASDLNIRPPTVAVALRRMEHAGLVERRTHETDRRISRISLTEEGRALSNFVIDSFEQMANLLFEGFTPDELTCWMRLEERMKANLFRGCDREISPNLEEEGRHFFHRRR